MHLTAVENDLPSIQNILLKKRNYWLIPFFLYTSIKSAPPLNPRILLPTTLHAPSVGPVPEPQFFCLANIPCHTEFRVQGERSVADPLHTQAHLKASHIPAQKPWVCKIRSFHYWLMWVCWKNDHQEETIIYKTCWLRVCLPEHQDNLFLRYF